MFHIKVCGVRQAQDVKAVADAGGDAIGLNFFPPSVRYINPTDANAQRLSDLAQSLGLSRVGVFVNRAPDEIESIASRVGLDAIQLHGDEPLEIAAELVARGQRVIRAIKLPPQPDRADRLADRVDPWIDAGCDLLLDAEAGAAHGGSGKTLDWDWIGQWSGQRSGTFWVLAGGLSAENVAEAIASSGATAVDVASGVEQPRGTKCPQQIQRFVANAKRGWAGNS